MWKNVQVPADTSILKCQYMVPETVYTLKKCEVEAFFRGLITKAEFKNLSSTSTS